MQHLVLVHDLLDRQRHRARIGAEDGLHLVVEDERLRLARADVGLGLVVAVDDLDRMLAEQSALLVDLGGEHRHALDALLHVIRAGAGRGQQHAELYGLAACAPTNRGVRVIAPAAIEVRRKSRRSS